MVMTRMDGTTTLLTLLRAVVGIGTILIVPQKVLKEGSQKHIHVRSTTNYMYC